jgi:hypothetical protein
MRLSEENGDDSDDDGLAGRLVPMSRASPPPREIHVSRKQQHQEQHQEQLQDQEQDQEQHQEQLQDQDQDQEQEQEQELPVRWSDGSIEMDLPMERLVCMCADGMVGVCVCRWTDRVCDA